MRASGRLSPNVAEIDAASFRVRSIPLTAKLSAVVGITSISAAQVAEMTPAPRDGGHSESVK